MRSKIFLIMLFSFCVFNISAQDYRIISSNNNSITIEIKPNYSDTSEVIFNRIKFIKLNVENSFTDNPYDYGMPKKITRSVNVGVPSEYGNTIQIISSEYDIINGNLDFIRSDFNDQTRNKILERYNETTEGELVTFGEYGLVRNLQVQEIKIFPVQFDALSQSIKIYKKIIFKINYGNPSESFVRVDDFGIKNSIINYNTSLQWGIKNKAKLKKITPGVLASGNWYKFEAPTEGIYKITASELSQMGIDIKTVNPKTIKIYNGSGKELSEKILDDDKKDLTEVAIQVFGEEDGKFDNSDYILFYGRGTNFFEYDKNHKKKIRRFKNRYSLQNFFFITSGGSEGKRIKAKNIVRPNSNSAKTNYTKAFVYYEKNDFKLGETGREYLDKEVYTASNSSRIYLNFLKYHIKGTIVKYKYAFVNASERGTYLDVNVNGRSIDRTYISGGSSNVLGTYRTGTAPYKGDLKEEKSLLKFIYNASGIGQKGYLDFYEIEFDKELKAVDDSLIVFSPTDTNLFNEGNRKIIDYTLKNFSNSYIEVYDVTDYANIELLKDTQINGGECSFSVNEDSENIHKYLAINKSKYLKTRNIAKVNNSSIREISDGYELIIITDKLLKPEAERLAEYKTNNAPIKIRTKVFYVDEIVNEFSAGNFDPTAIRNFVKYAYDNWNIKPKYVLLLGDGNYDSYNLYPGTKNIVPTFQSRNFLAEEASYPEDSYYVKVSGNDAFMDLSIGRLCVENNEEAENAIEKIIDYQSKSEQGLWRSVITLIADDNWVPSNSGGEVHAEQSEVLSTIIPKSFSQNKIYLGEYKPIIVGSGRRKPEVNNEIINALNGGTIIANYIGHGSPTLWADERVFDLNEVKAKLKNNNYFFLSAATCDFGRYDNKGKRSASEELVLMKNKGAIGVFSSPRISFSSDNSYLNNQLYMNIFKKGDNNFYPTMGDFFMRAKNAYAPYSNNTRKFHLFGDPSLRLKLPLSTVEIDSINGNSLEENYQLKALSKTNIKGQVNKLDGNIDESFNGEVVISVFDSEKMNTLIDDDTDMLEDGGVLFKGRASVINGRFNANFVTPKDISYENKKGKIRLYAFSDKYDASGYSDKIVVGGLDTNTIADKNGPEIEIYFDNMNFGTSYLVNSNTTLLVKVSDQTGLNTTGTGIGHKFEGILNDNVEKPIDLTNYFIGDKDADGKSGIINYKLNDLETGEHKIKIKAWDVFNNLAEAETYFSVVNKSGLVIKNIVNFPNPFAYNTVFTFQHNLSKLLDVKIKIYTVTGRLIKEIQRRNIPERFVKIPWNGLDNDGDRIANGTYLYKIIVKSSDGEYSNNVLGKLSVIR